MGEIFMFSKLKTQIKELAKNAVLVAEAELGSGNGQAKKEKAIEYVVKNLKCPTLLKSLISLILSDFIDEVIEVAVNYMNSLSKTEGD
jgi:hypothetical protein